jgi:hypothetical protein
VTTVPRRTPPLASLTAAPVYMSMADRAFGLVLSVEPDWASAIRPTVTDSAIAATRLAELFMLRTHVGGPALATIRATQASRFETPRDGSGFSILYWFCWDGNVGSPFRLARDPRADTGRDIFAEINA